MVRSNQVILQEFLINIARVVSEGSSDEYVLMVLRKFTEGQNEVFPFLKHVNFDTNSINVDKKINSVNPELIGKFLKVFIKTLFSDLFMLLVKKRIPERLARDLEYLGVK